MDIQARQVGFAQSCLVASRVRPGERKAWRLPALVYLVLVWSAGSVPAGEATVREVLLTIPTYRLAAEDQNPPFHNPNALGAVREDVPIYNQNVYPYPMQTGISVEKGDETYRAVVLENDLVRVIVMPELGGRVYAAHDKTNGDFDFIYHNHVIKPSLVALRGAWISGGIEWNFPTRGHTTNTFSPVAHKIVEAGDGSVTCFVGTTEWVRRMKWAVAITVFPDRSCFRTRILLDNPTLTDNRAYFWANAATHAWPDTRVIFPPADHTFAGMRRNPEPWPINHGRDVSWYRNTPFAHDYFCGVPGDFHGAYNYDRDCGTVHTASRYESPGQKFWTWGTAPSGTIWEDLLTDNDGQYIEVQAGRLPTQGDTWIFEPHMHEEWDEYWYPVQGMQGFVKANSQAAVNLDVKQGRAFMAVNTTCTFTDAELRLLGDGELLWQTKLSPAPGAPWREEIAVTATPETWQLELLDASGRPILSYSTKPEPMPKPDLEPDLPTDESASAEEIYLAGYYALKHWKAERAETLFKKSLEKDQGFTPALRGLAILRYRAGDYAKARELANRVLDRNEDDDTARYYRALSKIRLGITERTREDLYLIGRRADYRHVAPYVLASLAVADGNLAEAETLLRRSIAQNPEDHRAQVMLAAILRCLDRKDEAAALLKEVLASDPLDASALVERLLLTGEEVDVSRLAEDPQVWIEAACVYLEMNLLDDASDVLRRFASRPGGAGQPFVYFYLGYLADRLGQADQAREHYGQGLALDVKSVFPFRLESLAVLRSGLKFEPDDWKLHYYLGTLLTAKGCWQEGLEEFLAAEKSHPNCSVLYANLGVICANRVGDAKRAQEAFEKALACDPTDYHYYVALDSLYAASGDKTRRERLFARTPPEVESDFRVRFCRAGFCYDMGRYDEALDVLRRTTFIPWEGATAVHVLYQQTLNARADERMKNGDYRAAIDDLKLAMEYPRNLGVGCPHDPDFSRQYYQIGVCYRAIKEENLAAEFFKKAADSPAPSPWSEKAREALEGAR